MHATLMNRIPARSVCYPFLALCLALVMAAPSVSAEYRGKYPYKVGTTVGMIADIVKEVAGEKAVVTNMIGTGVDPHLFNPTRSDVAVLLKSDIVFYAGLLLEGQMTDILLKISRRRPVYAVTELLDDSYLIQDAGTNHSDPHVWMDVRGWMKAVEVVAAALSEFDPANAAGYQKNAAGYQARLEQR